MSKKLFILCCCLLFAVSLLLAGCAASSGGSQSAAESESGDKFDELKDNAKSAWHVASFAMNVANPVYYAKKGAKYGYDNYIKHDDETGE